MPHREIDRGTAEYVRAGATVKAAARVWARVNTLGLSLESDALRSDCVYHPCLDLAVTLNLKSLPLPSYA